MTAAKIHYLARRREFEANVEYYADELDLLGFYLENGFNIGDKEFSGAEMLFLTQTRKELDPFFVARAEGIQIAKPELTMTKWWQDILEHLEDKKPRNWLESSYILLSVHHKDQEDLQRSFEGLKKRVRFGQVKNKYNWVGLLTAPTERQFFLAAYPYSSQTKEERNSVLGGIVGGDKAAAARGAVCIGQDINSIDWPYTVLAVRDSDDLLLKIV